MARLGIVAVGLALVVGVVLGGIVGNSFPASANAACTDGVANAIWTAGNGNCYMRFDIPKNYYGARRDCENRGGYLATLTSADENGFVWANVGSTYAWFGFTDAATEGQWQWITGEVAVVAQNVVYTNWASGEPSDTPGGEDGGTYNYSGDGKWNDAALNLVNSYICEIETSPTYAVGGFAELPAVAGSSGSGMGGATYAVIAGAAAGVLAFAVLGTVAVRRRGVA